ncbi:hypothetical protein AB0K00_30270 [Dactylosporangium sp. NPDC049525]|uniref:hypothetical protein n=1 Tax=Dactylosporangium sp. NPDC049525 TaxID=3154730 RepID=UPI003429C50D
MFDLSILIDLARDNPAATGLVGTGTVGGLSLFFRARLRKARRIDHEAGMPSADGPRSPIGRFGRLMDGIDRFVTNREKAARRNRVLEHAAQCDDAERRKTIAELEKAWTLAETQEALNARITADLEMSNRPELEGAREDPPPPKRGPRQGRRR